jgi:hypothetical protein
MLDELRLAESAILRFACIRVIICGSGAQFLNATSVSPLRNSNSTRVESAWVEQTERASPTAVLKRLPAVTTKFVASA